MYSPLAVDFHTGVSSVDVAVVLSDADLFFAPHTIRPAAVFFGDADILACVAVVSTGRALLGVSITLTFPSSACDFDTFFSLDFDFLGTLLVSVGGGEDAERDSAEPLACSHHEMSEIDRLTELWRRNPV